MKGRLLLDVVVRKGASIFKLLSSEDQTLLVWGDTFFVLDLGLDLYGERKGEVSGRVWGWKRRGERTNIVDGVRGLDLEGDLYKG